MNKLCNRPTYRRIEVPLPALPDGTSLPPSIYFDVDTRFTDTQTIRIRNTIIRVIAIWLQHFQQKEVSPYLSQLAVCSQKYATNKLNPIWYKGPRITDGAEAANFAMDTLTQRFIENGSGKAGIAKINYCLPEPEERSTIRAKTAKCKCRVALSVTINPQAIDNPVIPALDLAGSMLHAWFHRMGYIHPENIYTTFLIAEAPMCVMRGFQDKTPGVSDTIFTQYFD